MELKLSKITIHKTHITAGDWTQEVDASLFTIEEVDGVQFAHACRDWRYDSVAEKMRYSELIHGERECYLLVGDQAYFVLHIPRPESKLADYLSMKLVGSDVGDGSVFASLKEHLKPGGKFHIANDDCATSSMTP